MHARLKSALLCATMIGAALPAYAALPALPEATPQITGAIDEAQLATLTGDHPAAISRALDHGALDASHMLTHVMIGLKRPPALQAAFDKLVREQTRVGSPNYHNWLIPADLRRFGPAQADIDKVVAWLQSHNITVNRVTPSGMMIDAGGRAGDFATAFHTSLHNVALKGEAHIANIADPAIPAALSAVVHGVTLSNFFPKPNVVPARPLFNIPATGQYPAFQAVAPADFATIYNENPLFNGNNAYGAPITGAGVTIAVVEQTDILPVDIKYFRAYFGLSGYKGTLTVAHPGNCGNPGFTPDEGEAALDGEWAGAAAPDADVIEASCPGSETSFGVETTLQNLVETVSTPATIYSISYGGSEASNGLTFLQGWENLVEEGASQGISIFVSSDDSGSSGQESVVTQGLAVNGLASNEFVTAIGGTDFYDAALGEVNQYWYKASAKGGRSVKSYVPEIPWDNSCANSIVAKVQAGTTGLAYCNEAPKGGLQNGIGGGGGQSIVYAKPDWQLTSVPGVPNDGARDLPDVSLFAANGIWNHFYLYCMSDAREGGAPCKYTGTTQGVPNALFQAAGGTSFAAPAFAGVAAVLSSANAVTTPGGGIRRLGNVAPRLYQLAQVQYGSALGTSTCNSTLGKGISGSCVFNDVTAGDNAEPCAAGTPNCYAPKAVATQGLGVLTASTSKPIVPSWPATPGYDLATGLGTVNVENLIYNY
jgi:subtilase family serine protease